MTKKQVNKKMSSGFHRKLLSWYDETRRDLPWRRETDPYRIWLSEVMLQQTRVETVIPYYHRFLAAYPDVSALASAKQDDVLKLWEGLGYYARARNFLQAVREIEESYAGCVPQDPDEFARLCGVGEYTRAAVASIAFNQPLAVVDGNVKRVFCRLFNISQDPAKTVVKKQISQLAQDLLDLARPGDYNQAVMELGAVICIPRSPRCSLCPVSQFCQALSAGKAAELPVRQKKKKLPVHTLVAAVVIRDGKCLLRQRVSETLLQGLWELPNVVVSAESETATQKFSALLGCDVTLGEELMRLQHAFTHLRWEVTVCCISTIQSKPLAGDWFWAGADDLDRLAFPAVYHPLLAELKKRLY